MTKIQYQGLSEVRSIAAGDTINGAVVGGLPVTITWNQANNWMIDTTQAPYTGITGPMATAILGLAHGEFVDVSSVAQTPTHTAIYGAPTVSGQAAPTHQVSSGATPTVASGAGSTAGAVGANGANDQAGTVTCTSLASGNAADAVLITVAFAQAYSTPPKDVQVNPLNAASANVIPYGAAVTVNGFSILGHVAAGVSQALSFSYSITG